MDTTTNKAPIVSDDTQVDAAAATVATATTAQQEQQKTEGEHRETIEEAYAHQLVEQGERYMVAVDGSRQSGKAFKWVLKQAAMARDPSKVEVVIINFLPECDFGVEVSEDYQRAKHELSSCLAEYKRILGSIGISSVVKMVEGAGDVRESLCQHAKEEGIHTLVLGNTGKSGLQRMLLGSVSEHCIRHAHCAVVVVK